MQNDFPSRNGAPINFTTGLMIKGVNLSGNDGAKAVSLKVKDTDTVSTTIYDWIRATDALVAGIVQNGGLYITQNLTALGAVLSTTSVNFPPSYTVVNTSAVTLATAPPTSVVRGSVVLISSDDALPETSGSYLAELCKVQDVTDNVITFKSTGGYALRG